MKKFLGIIIAIIAIFIIGFAIYNLINKNNSNNFSNTSSEYNAIRTTVEINNTIESIKPVESELYSFSTPIKSTDDNRLTNLKLTCNKINGTIVKAGSEFSFYKVVGPSEAKDGYKIADALDADGNTIKLIGGGNCQVSTTIYNAALGTSGLKVTERHEHSNDVPYIEDGKDAAVAYGHLDLKFKNTNNYDIKLYSTVNDNKVIVKIFRVS